MRPEDLTTFRKGLELTLEKLAHQLDVTTSTVWRWEHQDDDLPKLVEFAIEYLKSLYNSASNRIIEIKIAEPKFVTWSALRIIAEKRGYFSEAGLSVKSIECATAMTALEYLRKDEVSMAFAAQRLVEDMIKDGGNIINLCEIMHSDKAIKGINTHKKIDNLNQFESDIKKIFYPQSSDVKNYLNEVIITNFKNSRPQLDEVPQGNNLSKDVLKFMQQEKNPCAFFGWEPYIHWIQRSADAYGLRVYNIPNSITQAKRYSPVNYSVAVSLKFAGKNLDAILRFFSALVKAEEVIENSKQDAILLLSKELDMAENRVGSELEDHKFECVLNRKAIWTLWSQMLPSEPT